jgi:hypothetical protein
MFSPIIYEFYVHKYSKCSRNRKHLNGKKQLGLSVFVKYEKWRIKTVENTGKQSNCKPTWHQEDCDCYAYVVQQKIRVICTLMIY